MRLHKFWESQGNIHPWLVVGWKLLLSGQTQENIGQSGNNKKGKKYLMSYFYLIFFFVSKSIVGLGINLDKKGGMTCC